MCSFLLVVCSVHVNFVEYNNWSFGMKLEENVRMVVKERILKVEMQELCRKRRRMLRIGLCVLERLDEVMKAAMW